MGLCQAKEAHHTGSDFKDKAEGKKMGDLRRLIDKVFLQLGELQVQYEEIVAQLAQRQETKEEQQPVQRDSGPEPPPPSLVNADKYDGEKVAATSTDVVRKPVAAPPTGPQAELVTKIERAMKAGKVDLVQQLLGRFHKSLELEDEIERAMEAGRVMVVKALQRQQYLLGEDG